jgi:hypothetical protein
VIVDHPRGNAGISQIDDLRTGRHLLLNLLSDSYRFDPPSFNENSVVCFGDIAQPVDQTSGA